MTLMDSFKAIIKSGAERALSMEAFIAREVNDWLRSDARKWMQTGVRYYKNQNDILERKRYGIGMHGELVIDEKMANNRIAHAVARKLVDQKAEYLLGREFSVTSENEAFQKALGEVMDRGFRKMLKNGCVDAVNKGIAWVHVYYDDKGAFRMKLMPTEEMLPFWADTEHTRLDALARVYAMEAYDGPNKRLQQFIEYWDATGVRRFLMMQDGQLAPDIERGEHGSHITRGAGKEAQARNWERLPFVAFKYNRYEQPLIQFIKALIDDYDRNKSDHSNELEDLLNYIFVLQNYDGTDLAEFRRNLALYRAVKVSDDGGVDTLAASPATEAFVAHQAATRKDIFEFGRGVDNMDETVQSPSGVALRFLYADLDLDCAGIETEFQASLEQLLWFIKAHLKNSGAGDFINETVDIVFNKDIPVNESDVIANARASKGLISDETIIEQHPWVKDPEQELARVRVEQDAALEKFGEAMGDAHEPIR